MTYLRCVGALKELAATHREELENFSKIDVDAVMDITYLNEFDRLIQYVARSFHLNARLTSLDALFGDILRSMLTTGMLRQSTLSYQSRFLSWPSTPPSFR